MSIGVDVGTYNMVVCRRGKDNNFIYKREVNAFIEMPIDNRFVFNMMKQAGVPLIERPEAGIAYALGEAAVNIAYTMNQIELKRPMKDGCLNPKEKNAQQIMSLMIHGLVEKSEENEVLYYGIPANAINFETDSDYHDHVLQAIFKAFEDDKGHKVIPNPINEGLALIYAELKEKNYTGIGISFGAGMVNLCYAMFGAPVKNCQFSIVNSGDWIDKQSARATGETPAFINKAKTDLDLTKGQESLVLRAIKAQYEIMMQKTITEIKKGVEVGKPRNPDHPIDIVIAGGASLPNGFDKVFGEMISKAHMPFEVGQIIRPADPLYSVARGCLLAAENAV